MKKQTDIVQEFVDAASEGDVKRVSALLQAGVDANACGMDGQTALSMAAWFGHMECARLLIDAGVEVSLFEAAMLGDIERVRGAIKAGDDVNGRFERNALTPLMAAVSKGNADCARLLIEAGADVKMRDVHQDAALSKVGGNDQGECARLLIDAGADVNAQGMYGYTALMSAAGKASAENVSVLLEAGAFVNAKSEFGETALMSAAKNGRVENARLLIKAGAVVDMGTASGRTALMQAANWGHTECVRLLVEAGANMNIRDFQGETALIQAAKNGRLECARVLIEAGADVRVRSKGLLQGKTALKWAETKGHTEMVALLRKAAR